MNKTQIRKLGRVDSEKNREKLRNELKKIQRKAKIRLNNLNKYYKGSTYRGYVYEKVTMTLESMSLDTFDYKADLTSSQLSLQLETAQMLVNAKTGTIKGIEQQDILLRKNARKVGVKLSKEDTELFAEFLSNKLVQELVEFDSGRGFRAIHDAIKKGITTEELKEAWGEYREGRLRIDEAWTKWTGINPFL